MSLHPQGIINSADMYSFIQPVAPFTVGNSDFASEPEKSFSSNKKIPSLDPNEPAEPKQPSRSQIRPETYRPTSFGYYAGPCKPPVTGIHSIDNNTVARITHAQPATALLE